jgi:vacuolar-type H+-ATPase subunit E/Vma4
VELSTTALIVEAAARLPDGACVVVVPAAVAAILDDAWRVHISRRTGRRLSVEAGPLTAGCIVRLADRPMTYDNSLEARERRTQVEWRAALARVYAEEVSRIEDRTGRPVAAADAAGARA